MPIEVRLYGNLKGKINPSSESAGNLAVLEFYPTKIDTVSDLLEALCISEDEVDHVFIDGKYLGKYFKAIFTKGKFLGVL